MPALTAVQPVPELPVAGTVPDHVELDRDRRRDEIQSFDRQLLTFAAEEAPDPQHAHFVAHRS